MVIHHNDADGRCAAAIVGRSNFMRTGDGKLPTDIEYIEADYAKTKDELWVSDICDRVERAYDSDPDYTVIFVVDFSLPEAMMARLRQVATVYWIDHHVTAAKYDYQDMPGLRDYVDKRSSGCELAWRYCFPDEAVPQIVTLIGDYDTWRLQYEDRCKPLIVAMDASQTPPGHTWWTAALGLCDALPNDIVNNMILQGDAMIEYRDGYCKGLADAYGYETEWEGHKCYALNVYRMGSMAFGDKMKKYDICLAYIHDGQQFTFSAYSEKPEIDCGALCKNYGGGGHRSAAGAVVYSLPFEKKEAR